MGIIYLFIIYLVLVYPKVGHSHNATDRVVAWCCNKMKGVNLYAPNEIVAKMNETKSYFTNMPSGYTGNYFFEIDGGIVLMKHLVTTLNEDAQHHSLIGCGDAGTIRRAFLRDLFGRCDLDSATAGDVTPPRQPLLSQPTRKLTSLSLKYFSIPAQFSSDSRSHRK
eukprot:jgi/Phyca11/103768/e_gw1.8.761.1